MGQKELIAISGFPALIWIVASCLAAKDNVIVMGNTALLGYPLFGLHVSEFTLFTPLPLRAFVLFYMHFPFTADIWWAEGFPKNSLDHLTVWRDE